MNIYVSKLVTTVAIAEESCLDTYLIIMTTCHACTVKPQQPQVMHCIVLLKLSAIKCLSMPIAAAIHCLIVMLYMSC